MFEVLEKEDDLEIFGRIGEAFEEELGFRVKYEFREEKIFRKFKIKIVFELEQSFRYGRGIVVIWIFGENIFEEQEILDCFCGVQRIFEFQIMFQLFSCIQVGRLGGSIVLGSQVGFVCVENCRLGIGYIEDFVWK